MRAEIISIGNELLIGKTVNTNATWLAKKLTVLGFSVKRIIVVPDDKDDIVKEVRESINRKTRVIIMTGGLGPTFDDKTSESLAKALGRKWILNEEAYQMVKSKYERKGLPLTEHRLKMAKMPENAKPIPNPVGTAPGIQVEHNETLIIALPGVPSEMKAMFEQYVEPELRNLVKDRFFIESRIIVKGIPESTLAPIIDKVLKANPLVYIKSHPKGAELEKPVIELHLYTSSNNKQEALNTLERAKELLRKELLKITKEVFEE
mgnify:CR=1 FL=1